MLRFMLPSLLGILLFMIPFSFNNEVTILIAIASKYVQNLLTGVFPAMITGVFTLSFVGTLITKLLMINKPDIRNSFLVKLFNVSYFWVAARFLGTIFSIMTYFQLGTKGIWSDDTGGLILNGLLPILFSVFLLAGLFLPLLLNFGLLEMCGVLLKKIMRPVFLLPGRSSIDCLTSWLGDGTIGVLLTSKQYEEGYYTKREAAIIGTTFSVVSITFSLVVITQVHLEHMFIPYYLTVLLAGVIAAIICPRIPPLSRKPDTYYKKDQKAYSEDIPEGYTSFKWGLKQAIERARNNNISGFFKNGMENILDMWLGVTPIVMAFGTLGLIIATYTPIFKFLGYPFIPLLEFMQVPEAKEASQAIIAGFADMFLPSVMISGIKSEMTRFIVACVSVTQLIYMSEVGSLLLASKIPVTFKDIGIVFLQRTVITLPIIVIVAHFLF